MNVKFDSIVRYSISSIINGKKLEPFMYGETTLGKDKIILFSNRTSISPDSNNRYVLNVELNDEVGKINLAEKSY